MEKKLNVETIKRYKKILRYIEKHKLTMLDACNIFKEDYSKFYYWVRKNNIQPSMKEKINQSEIRMCKEVIEKSIENKITYKEVCRRIGMKYSDFYNLCKKHKIERNGYKEMLCNKIYDEAISTNKSVKEICDKYNITVNRFLYWKRKNADKVGNTIQDARKKKAPSRWNDIIKRLLEGEKVIDLAKEYNLQVATIRKNFNKLCTNEEKKQIRKNNKPEIKKINPKQIKKTQSKIDKYLEKIYKISKNKTINEKDLLDYLCINDVDIPKKVFKEKLIENGYKIIG